MKPLQLPPASSLTSLHAGGGHGVSTKRVFRNFGADDAGNHGATVNADTNLERMRRAVTDTKRSRRYL